ncbi:hypothetical protein GQ53DRAFT_884223 [Thozetella sp. PMI_491]|nr:hypothetical protein GQ53DRAFT_884223 [Thozetella sp. PMI_491]
MKLDERTGILLGSDKRNNERDSLDFVDVEQSPYRNPLSNGKEAARGGWMRRRWRDQNWRELVAVAMLVAIICGALGYAIGVWARNRSGTARRPDTASLRVMIAGDSISQGYESMHTWRYRLWEWFQSNDVPVLFVGPFHRAASQAADLTPGVPLPVARPYEEYDSPDAMDDSYALDVDPEFLRTGSAHFAIWGREVAQDLDIIEQQIREYRPEYLLVELGFNDLAWGARGSDELLLLMKQFVDKARSVAPELRFAIANVPQREKIGDLDARTRQYNQKLREAIPTWSLPSSPVYLVEFRETYTCKCPSESISDWHGDSSMAHMATMFKFGEKARNGKIRQTLPKHDTWTPLGHRMEPHGSLE